MRLLSSHSSLRAIRGCPFHFSNGKSALSQNQLTRLSERPRISKDILVTASIQTKGRFGHPSGNTVLQANVEMAHFFFAFSFV